MTGRTLTLNDLLQRVHLNQKLDDAIPAILRDYNLGTYISFTPILVGHEEMNLVLNTSTGQFVIKFLNQHKTRDISQAIVTAMQHFYQAGIPVPRMHPHAHEDYLYTMPKEVGQGYLFIMDYFDGLTFNQQSPTTENMLQISQIMAMMHQLNFATHPEYDIWLPQHLSQEYTSKAQYLSQGYRDSIGKVVQELNQVDLNQCPKGIGHFDLHRDNIKINQDSNYCLFDLATVDYHHAIYDLGAFIGLFCFDPTQTLQEQRFLAQEVIKQYEQHRPLTSYEKNHLPIFIKVIFASNVLAANYLIHAENDDTEETLKWLRLGEWGLKQFAHINSLT